MTSESERAVVPSHVPSQSPGPSHALPDSPAVTPTPPKSPSHGEHLQMKKKKCAVKRKRSMEGVYDMQCQVLEQEMERNKLEMEKTQLQITECGGCTWRTECPNLINGLPKRTVA